MSINFHFPDNVVIQNQLKNNSCWCIVVACLVVRLISWLFPCEVNLTLSSWKLVVSMFDRVFKILHFYRIYVRLNNYIFLADDIPGRTVHSVLIQLLSNFWNNTFYVLNNFSTFVHNHFITHSWQLQKLKRKWVYRNTLWALQTTRYTFFKYFVNSSCRVQ